MPKPSSSLIRLGLLLLLPLLASCVTTSKYPSGSFRLEGEMHYSDIEGGCWVFKARDGQAYELVGKDVKKLQKDGLRAEVVVKPRLDLASICMVGRIVEVLEIRKVYSD